jgi:hypothetical protein
MLVRLDIEIWEIGEGGTKRVDWKWVGLVREDGWGLLDFVALVCFLCISIIVV